LARVESEHAPGAPNYCATANESAKAGPPLLVPCRCQRPYRKHIVQDGSRLEGRCAGFSASCQSASGETHAEENQPTGSATILGDGSTGGPARHCRGPDDVDGFTSRGAAARG